MIREMMEEMMKKVMIKKLKERGKKRVQERQSELHNAGALTETASFIRFAALLPLQRGVVKIRRV